MKKEEGDVCGTHASLLWQLGTLYKAAGNVESLVGTLEMNSRCVCDSGTV